MDGSEWDRKVRTRREGRKAKETKGMSVSVLILQFIDFIINFLIIIFYEKSPTLLDIDR